MVKSHMTNMGSNLDGSPRELKTGGEAYKAFIKSNESMSDQSSNKNSTSSNESMNSEETSTEKATPGKLAQLISHGTWHPFENTFAVARHNSLFVFTEKRN